LLPPDEAAGSFEIIIVLTAGLPLLYFFKGDPTPEKAGLVRKNKTPPRAGKQPNDANRFLNLVEASVQNKSYKEALEQLDRAGKADLISSSSPELYRYHYLRGMALFWLGDHRTAWNEVQEALRAFKRIHRPIVLPESTELPAFVARNLNQLRNMELALLEALEGPGLDENSHKKQELERRISEISASLEYLAPLAKLHQLAGSVLRHLGKLSESVNHLEWAATGFRLSRDWGSLAETLNRMALIHIAQGELGQAIQILEQARTCSLKAKNQYFEMILRSNVALCQLLTGNWKLPLASLPDVLAETKKEGDFPRYATTLLLWGSANLLSGRLKESRKTFLSALQICVEKNLVGVSKYGHGYLADLCMAEGRLEEAEEHLKTVVEISQQVSPHGENMAELWVKFGELYLARGEFRQALNAYRTGQDYLSQRPEKLVEGELRRGMGICHLKLEQFRPAQKDFKNAFEIFESCGNEWELAKTAVLAAENGAFAAAEIYPKLVWAKEIFKKLEYSTWRKRVQLLLEHGEEKPSNVPFRVAHRLAEKEEIAKALAETNGNISQAAKKLGLLRQSLQYKIKQYKIDA